MKVTAMISLCLISALTAAAQSNPAQGWDGLRAYIGFDDRTETHIYDSVSNASFEVNGVQYEAGVNGSAARFDGNANATYVIPNNNDAADPFTFSTDQISIAFWFKTDDKRMDVDARGQIEMLSKSGSIFNWGFERAIENSWQSWMRYYTRATDTLGGAQAPFNKNYQEVEYRLDREDSYDLRDGQWHHIVVTLNTYNEAYGIDALGVDENLAEQRVYRLYIDGQLYDEEISNLEDIKNSSSVARFVLGARYKNDTASYDRHFVGSLDELYIFDRVISADEVGELYTHDAL